MSLSWHAVDRASDRLRDAGMNPDDVLRLANDVARQVPRGSVAVRLACLAKSVGDLRDDVMTRASNGDEVWAVVRDGVVRTVMLRRSTQPRDPGAFGVDRVLRVA